MLYRKVGSPPIKKNARVEDSLRQHRLIIGTDLVNCHHLLMQVIERSPSRLKPVLENHHISHMFVVTMQLSH